MDTLNKTIFGRHYRFVSEPDLAPLAAEAVAAYPVATSTIPDVEIHLCVGTLQKQKTLAENPKIFRKDAEGITLVFPACTVRIMPESVAGKLRFDLAMHNWSWLRIEFDKWRSPEYSRPVEALEQWIHELILVPSTYFFDNLCPVHAASFAYRNQTMILAGTGGTGKTSALLALRRHEDIQFLADDISVVSDDGTVHPNLAWSKVYAYNLSDDLPERELLADRGVVDKLQFRLKKRIDPACVRRKLPPARLYRNVANAPCPVGCIAFLFRERRSDFGVEQMSAEQAVDLNVQVMLNEYHVFHQFLRWDAYNSRLLGIEPILRLEAVLQQWRVGLRKAIGNACCVRIGIPLNVQHEKFVERMRALAPELEHFFSAKANEPEPIEPGCNGFGKSRE